LPRSIFFSKSSNILLKSEAGKKAYFRENNQKSNEGLELQYLD